MYSNVTVLYVETHEVHVTDHCIHVLQECICYFMLLRNSLHDMSKQMHICVKESRNMYLYGGFGVYFDFFQLSDSYLLW